MAAPLRIYLSGSIRKGDDDPRPANHFWSEHEEALLLASVLDRPVELLNPARTSIRRNDPSLNFGCDLYLVSISDLILVDGRTNKGIGVGAEMMFAVQRGLPVITWAPPESHYRRRFMPNVYGEDLLDWTHPFVLGLSDYVVDTLDEAIALIRRHVEVAPLPRNVDVDRHIVRYAAQMEQG